MSTKPSRQAWFHGLPGYTMSEGVPVEVVNFIPPKPKSGNFIIRFRNWLLEQFGIRITPRPDRSKLNIAFVASHNLKVSLQKLSANRTSVPQLRFVIRTDSQKEADNEYQMADAIIEFVRPRNNIPAALDVNISYNSITWQMGWTNPGPPLDAPEVQDNGNNTGWIFGSSSDHQRAISCNIVNFTPPCFNGQLKVIFGKLTAEIQPLLNAHTPLQELILVLPDRRRLSYVEYKLWNVRASIEEDSTEKMVVFESVTIEYSRG